MCTYFAYFSCCFSLIFFCITSSLFKRSTQLFFIWLTSSSSFYRYKVYHVQLLMKLITDPYLHLDSTYLDTLQLLKYISQCLINFADEKFRYRPSTLNSLRSNRYNRFYPTHLKGFQNEVLTRPQFPIQKLRVRAARSTRALRMLYSGIKSTCFLKTIFENGSFYWNIL